MADKRMFSMKIIDSDAFLEMPLSTQALYFHLSMRADDDGFVGNPRKITNMVGASVDDFKLLLTKRFILSFDSGVIVIKHWRINNYIRNDRYKETTYIEEKNTLQLDQKEAYTERKESIGIPNDNQVVDNRYTQISIDKNRLDKNRLDKVSLDNDLKSNSNLNLNEPELLVTVPTIREFLEQNRITANYYSITDYINENKIENWQEYILNTCKKSKHELNVNNVKEFIKQHNLNVDYFEVYKDMSFNKIENWEDYLIEHYGKDN